MKARMFTCCRILAILAMVVAILVAIPVSAAPTPPVAKTVESLGMFSVPKWTVHYRAPNTDQIETLLEREGIPLAGPEARAQAVQVFRQKWAERNPTTPNPEKLRKLLEKERQGKQAPWLLRPHSPRS